MRTAGCVAEAVGVVASDAGVRETRAAFAAAEPTGRFGACTAKTRFQGCSLSGTGKIAHTKFAQVQSLQPGQQLEGQNDNVKYMLFALET